MCADFSDARQRGNLESRTVYALARAEPTGTPYGACRHVPAARPGLQPNMPLQLPKPGPAPAPRQAPQPPAPLQPPKLQTLDNASKSTGKHASAYSRQETHNATFKGQSKGGDKNKGKGGLGKVCRKGYVAGRGQGKGKSREPRVPEAPVDSAGKWVLREEFLGKKSFGFFACRCGRSWTTAHAQKEYRQGCQACDAECFPSYMWLNDPSVERRERADRDELDVPHDFERCEACRQGVCSAVRMGARIMR